MEHFLLHLTKTSVLVGVVIALTLIARPVLQKRFAAKARYWLWLVLAVALLPLPVYTGANAPVQITPPSEHVFVWPDTQAVTPKIVHKDVFIPEEITPARPSAAPVTDGVIAPQPVRRMVEVSTVLFWAWLAGTAVFLAVQGVGYARFRRLTRRWSEEAKNARYFEILREEADALGVTAPRLTLCAPVPTPALTGLAHPTLLLPHENYAETELRFILRHELYHLKRRDILYKSFLTLVGALHWFNPLVYLMLRAADEDIELSCDSAVTADMEKAERAAYSETLLKSVREKHGAVALTTCFGSTLERLKRRLANVFDDGKKSRGVAVVILTVCAVASLSAAVGFAPAETKNTPNTHGEYADVEDYLMQTMPAIGEKLTLGEISSPFQAYGEQGSAVVLDRRLAWLNQTGTITDLAPKGTLQAWTYLYLLKLDGAEEDLALYRGDYEENGYIDFGGRGEHILITLQYDDGSIDVLYDAPSIGFTDNYNSYDEALYDWYVIENNLDQTEYPLYVLDWRELLPDNYPAGNYPVRRYDGDGWYMYIPVSAWEPGVGEPIWYSSYGTDSTIVVKTFDTPLDQAQEYFRREGWEGMNEDMIFVSYEDRFSNVYLYERPDGGHYEVQLFADFEKMAEIAETCPEADKETPILIRMAQSFTVDERFAGAPERVAFDDIMGLSGFYSETTDGAGFVTRQYYVPAVVGGYTPIGESFGYAIDDHIVDLDGDGVTELVCNCQYGADGAQRVFVYRLKDGAVEQGFYDSVYSTLADYNNWGVNSSQQYYAAGVNEFVLHYDTKDGSTAVRKFSYRELDFIPYAMNDMPYPQPVLPEKASSTTGTATGTQSRILEIDGKPVSLSAHGFLWYASTDGRICREKDGKTEELYELPINYMTDTLVYPSLTLAEDYVTLAYHIGGATMGSDVTIRFLDDGSYVEMPANSSTSTRGDLWVSISNFVPPERGNLRISRDGGETWSAFGSAEILYGWAYSKEGEHTSASCNGTMYFIDDAVYLLGTHLDAPFDGTPSVTRVCRVDLTTGKTEMLTGEAKEFSIVGQWIQYTSPNGTGHTCPLDGDLVPTVKYPQAAQ